MGRDEATERLRAAIIDHARAFGLIEDDELLDDFAIVAHWQRIEADGSSRYTTQFNRDNVATHTASGLFRCGVRFVERDEDVD